MLQSRKELQLSLQWDNEHWAKPLPGHPTKAALLMCQTKAQHWAEQSHLRATTLPAQGTIPFPFCLCCRFPGQSTEGFAGGLQPSRHQQNTGTSWQQNKQKKSKNKLLHYRMRKLKTVVNLSERFIFENCTFDSSMGSAIMKCSVNLFLSSIWVFLSFAVKTWKWSNVTTVNTFSEYSIH